jgi:hypothetical protein
MTRFEPSRCSTRTWMPTRSGWNTPSNWFFGAGGIRQRPEDVEDRAHAELLAHRRGMLHRRVMRGSET